MNLLKLSTSLKCVLSFYVRRDKYKFGEFKSMYFIELLIVLIVIGIILKRIYIEIIEIK